MNSSEYSRYEMLLYVKTKVTQQQAPLITYDQYSEVFFFPVVVVVVLFCIKFGSVWNWEKLRKNIHIFGNTSETEDHR